MIVLLPNPVFRPFTNVLLCGSRLPPNRPKLGSSWCFRLQVRLLSFLFRLSVSPFSAHHCKTQPFAAGTHCVDIQYASERAGAGGGLH